MGSPVTTVAAMLSRTRRGRGPGSLVDEFTKILTRTEPLSLHSVLPFSAQTACQLGVGRHPPSDPSLDSSAGCTDIRKKYGAMLETMDDQEVRTFPITRKPSSKIGAPTPVGRVQPLLTAHAGQSWVGQSGAHLSASAGRLDSRPGAGAGRLDSHMHDVVVGQRSAPPASGDMGERPVLDRVPLRRAWWEVADRDRQPGLGGERSQLALPHPVAIAVVAARVGGDQQP
jgi:hypothetical protein